MTIANTTPVNGGTVCELRGVTHDFRLPTGMTLRVIEDISFGVRPNEVLALLGPSGCGKSTILRILAGIIRPTAGEVLNHGRPLDGMNAGVAIVFQTFGLYPWMTVKQNVEIVLRARSLPSSTIRETVARTIKLVGLSGFEEAYPRELSGGMKQRVGIARALAVAPELLFMDEPFSQVDALTAESLRAELLDIWEATDRNPPAVLLVSHDIKEVVYMADRVVVLGARPGRVRSIVPIALPRPRDYRSPDFQRTVDSLYELITGHEMPDVAAAVAETPSGFEPLPHALPNEIIGLLEYLDARGGSQNLARIALETNRDFGHMIAITKAAEMLNLVDTPRQLVVLDADGRRLVRGDIPERQRIWREQLLKLTIFREIVQICRERPDRATDRDFILEVLAMSLPTEDPEKTFDEVVGWGRYGDLLAYDENSQRLWLQEADAQAASTPGV